MKQAEAKPFDSMQYPCFLYEGKCTFVIDEGGGVRDYGSVGIGRAIDDHADKASA